MRGFSPLCAIISKASPICKSRPSKRFVCRSSVVTSCRPSSRVSSGLGCTRRSRPSSSACSKPRSWRANRPPAARAWTSGKSSSWGSCGWDWRPTGIGWNPSPTTMPSCARCSACRPHPGARKTNGSAIKPCGTTSPCWTPNCSSKINAAIAAAGREGFAKKGGAPGAAREVKVDSYVLASDVHFPTGLNLLWAAGRKCADLVAGLRASGCDLPGWRKFKQWRRQLKACERAARQLVYRGGPNKAARVKSAVRACLAVGGELSAKVRQNLLGWCEQAVDASRWERRAYFHALLDQCLDLVERRLLKAETIPAHEKVFSLFEPHTE